VLSPHAHVRFIHHFDSPQPFYIVDAFPAGDQQANRIALLRTQAPRHSDRKPRETSSHRFLNRNTFCVLSFFPILLQRSTLLQTARPAFFEEYRKRETPVQTLQLVNPVCVLSRCVQRNSECFPSDRPGALSALHSRKMNSRYRRQALQFFHGENHGMVKPCRESGGDVRSDQCREAHSRAAITKCSDAGVIIPTESCVGSSENRKSRWYPAGGRVV